MNKSTSYSLSLTITLLLLFLGATTLLSNHLAQDLFQWMPNWAKTFIGIILYTAGYIHFASVVLDYSSTKRNIIKIFSIALLAVLAFSFWQTKYYPESYWLIAMALAMLFSTRFELRLFDWLQIATLGANLIIGMAVFARPDWVEINLPALNYPPMRISMGIGFISSAAIATISSLYASTSKKEQWHLLSIPWLLWGLLALMSQNVLQIIIATSAILGLLSSEIVPWQKVILSEGKNLGRRFFQLVSSGQGVSLLIIFILLEATASTVTASSQEIQYLRQIGLYSFFAVLLMGILLIIVINLSINGLFSGLSGNQTLDMQINQVEGIFSLLRVLALEPFRISQSILSQNIKQKQEYERLLAEMSSNEKRRMAQLNLMHQLNLELETVLDPPVSAQLTANAVNAAMNGLMCAIMQYDSERHEMTVLASSGPTAGLIPPGYRQSIQHGLIGRAARLRRTQLVSDTRLDPDFIAFESQNSLSELAVPIIFYNQLKGCIIVDHGQLHAFDDSDIRTLETIALWLVSSWQRSAHDQRLTRLIQAGVNLSTTLEVEAVIDQVAEIAQQTIDARFVFVALVDKGGGFTRTAHAGYAPTLYSILNSDPEGNTLIQTVLNQAGSIRVRDIRKKFSSTPTGSNDLRTMLAIPIRLRQSSIGVLLAFGKLGTTGFTENDEALGNLLTSQAAAAIETTWLYQELRSMLNTATLLYQLSTRVIQAEQLTDAAAAIAQTAYQLIHAKAAGIVLSKTQQHSETRVQIDSSGLHPGTRHPMKLIHQSIESGQNIILSAENEMARVCVPLQTPRHQYGALWVEVSEKNWANARFSDNLHTLANQAAIALERSILLSETRQQAIELEAAYRELEITYDQTLIALSSALDARDHETEGHSSRVARLTCTLGQFLGMDAEQAKTLERGAILHDIGKIGISDTILLKPGSLSDQEWETMKKHPDIGARIIEGIPFLQETLPIIRCHQERWDGSGYPLGLKGDEIPLTARIFAVVDAFDALTTERPYRNSISTKQALEYLREQSEKLFDPHIVEAFEQLLKSGGEKPT